MIVVHVDLWPQGSEAHAVRLGTVEIYNDLTGEAGRGNYVVRAWGRKNRPLQRFATVTGFPRRSQSALHLLRRALTALGY